MGRPFQMVSAEEHTAQVPGEVRNRIENDFKSAKGRTNCLVATPTLELGVNIGALDMALMRNVPPKSSNYWQRAGRAVVRNGWQWSSLTAVALTTTDTSSKTR